MFGLLRSSLVRLSVSSRQFTSVARRFPTVRYFSTENQAPAAGRVLGTVKWFDSSKGFGFITRETGEDIFVHFTAIRGSGYRALEEGQQVELTVGQGSKGPAASDVAIISKRS